jgi:phage regulator Rha-like protein
MGILRVEVPMSSREIAELCEKRHDHVMRDIRDMLDDLEITGPRFGGSYKDSTGRTLPCFHLPKTLVTTLVSGYSTKLRYRIVKRWEELEAKQETAVPAFQLPQSFSEALRLAAAIRLYLISGRRGAVSREMINCARIENGN